MIGDRWGVTQAEVDRHYPCDEILTSPGVQLWRGVSVRAPAAAVWPVAEAAAHRAVLL